MFVLCTIINFMMLHVDGLDALMPDKCLEVREPAGLFCEPVGFSA